MERTRDFALTLVALAVAGLALVPCEASAQIRTRDWDGGYRRPSPSRRDRDWVVRPLVDRAERQSNAFRAWFERSYSRRRLGDERDNRQVKREIQRMDEAMERLRGRADDRRPGRGREDLIDALDHAGRVDRGIARDPDVRFTHREWDDLRRTLDDLADLYDVRGL